MALSEQDKKLIEIATALLEEAGLPEPITKAKIKKRIIRENDSYKIMRRIRKLSGI